MNTPSRTETEPRTIAVIIPALNAAGTLAETIAALAAPLVTELVVVDGGSADATPRTARDAGARVIAAARGRGGQLAAGVAATRAPWLLLLHADTRLDPGWHGAAFALMQTGMARAGYFRFRLDSAAPAARHLERLVDWRCRWLGLPYGDQGLLVPRALLAQVGGIRPLPLMEDVDLVRRLGRRRLVALDGDAVTSARRWESEGWLRRSARNLACLSLYLLGVPPARIARLYE